MREFFTRASIKKSARVALLRLNPGAIAVQAFARGFDALYLGAPGGGLCNDGGCTGVFMVSCGTAGRFLGLKSDGELLALGSNWGLLGGGGGGP
jgi:hypothetical protein